MIAGPNKGSIDTLPVHVQPVRAEAETATAHMRQRAQGTGRCSLFRFLRTLVASVTQMRERMSESDGHSTRHDSCTHGLRPTISTPGFERDCRTRKLQCLRLVALNLWSTGMSLSCDRPTE